MLGCSTYLGQHDHGNLLCDGVLKCSIMLQELQPVPFAQQASQSLPVPAC